MLKKGSQTGFEKRHEKECPSEHSQREAQESCQELRPLARPKLDPGPMLKPLGSSVFSPGKWEYHGTPLS